MVSKGKVCWVLVAHTVECFEVIMDGVCLNWPRVLAGFREAMWVEGINKEEPTVGPPSQLGYLPAVHGHACLCMWKGLFPLQSEAVELCSVLLLLELLRSNPVSVSFVLSPRHLCRNFSPFIPCFPLLSSFLGEK